MASSCKSQRNKRTQEKQQIQLGLTGQEVIQFDSATIERHWNSDPDAHRDG
jgi:hypothetical protein